MHALLKFAVVAVLLSDILMQQAPARDMRKFFPDNILSTLHDEHGPAPTERHYVNKWDDLFKSTLSDATINESYNFLVASISRPQPWLYSDVKGFINTHTWSNRLIQTNPKARRRYQTTNDAAAAKALGDAGLDTSKLAQVAIRYRPTQPGSKALGLLAAISYDRGLMLLSSLFLDAIISDMTLSGEPISCESGFGRFANTVYTLAGRLRDASLFCPNASVLLTDGQKERASFNEKFQRLHLARLFSRKASGEENTLFKAAIHLSGVDGFILSQIASNTLPSQIHKPGDLLELLIACLNMPVVEGQMLYVPYVYFSVFTYSQEDIAAWASGSNDRGDYLCDLENEAYFAEDVILQKIQDERRHREAEEKFWHPTKASQKF